MLYINFITCNLLHSLIISSRFSVGSLKYKIISSENSDSFTISYNSYTFSCLIVFLNIFRTMLNSSGDREHLQLVSYLSMSSSIVLH